MKQENNYTIHVKFSKEEYNKIKELADKDYRTMPNLIYKVIKEVLKV